MVVRKILDRDRFLVAVSITVELMELVSEKEPEPKNRELLANVRERLNNRELVNSSVGQCIPVTGMSCETEYGSERVKSDILRFSEASKTSVASPG
jgi:hypothetical protein